MNSNRFSLALIFFFVVASFADILGVMINSLQLFVLGALLNPSGTGIVVAGVGAVIAFFEAYLIDFGITDSVLSALVLLTSGQFLVSLATLIVFYSIVLSSPKGSFSLSSCLIALGVFLLESLPLIAFFPFWGMFAWYLRGKKLLSFVLRSRR